MRGLSFIEIIVKKRTFDFVVALFLGVLFMPVILVVAVLVRLFIGNSIFFKQNRPGLHGEIFSIYKFCTMNQSRDAQGHLLKDAARLNTFGKLLRSSSLDELPSLWNVLKGEMSLVGPRPLLVEYLSLYSAEQAKRHEAKPGITGWAQVNGRNAISWEEKFKLDVWYVENQSFWLDIKILLLTIKKVFLRDGISAQGDVTMPKFTGNKKW